MTPKLTYAEDPRPLAAALKFGMMGRYQALTNRLAWSMHTPSPIFVPEPPHSRCSVIGARPVILVRRRQI